MRRSRWMWVGVYVGTMAILIAGVVVFIRHDRGAAKTAAVDQLPDLAPMPFPSTLSLAGPATTFIGTLTPLIATSYSPQGARSVELWDGARRVATAAPAAARPGATLTYPALSVGAHALYSQITDRAGKVSQSAVVEVTVAPVSTETPRAVPVEAEQGETPNDVAERLGVAPEAVVASPPGAGVATGEPTPSVGAGQKIPSGSAVSVILKGNEGLEAALGSGSLVTKPLPKPSSPLTLDGRTNGCDLVLTAKGSDGPVFYFDANAGVPGWASVGQTDGDGDLTLPGLEPGVHVFKARTDTLTAEPVSVLVPTACATDTGWRGTASIIDGSLVLPPGTTGSVWLYLTVDGQPALRVPATQSEKLQAGLVTPVASLLPPLSGKRLHLEVWSEVNGSDMAPQGPVATGDLDVPSGKTMTDVVGEPSGLTLKVQTPNKGEQSFYALGEQDTPLNFAWTASSDRVGEVLWQVTTQPHLTTDHEMVPDDLIAAGTSKLSSTEGPGTRGTFEIDSEDIPGRTFTGGQAVYQKSLQPPVVAITPPATPGSIGSLPKQSFGAVLEPTKVSEEVLAESKEVTLPSFGDAVYIRVVAKPQGPAVGSASPNATVVLPVPQGQNGKAVAFERDSEIFDPGRRANLDLSACAAVTVPWNGSGWAYTDFNGKETQFDQSATPPPGGWTNGSRFLSNLYPTSKTYCPSDFPPPEKCDSLLCDIWNGIVEAVSFAIGVIKQAYSIVSGIYNGVISTVVDLIADIGFCDGIGAIAGDDGVTKGCKGVVKTAARLAITAVLAAYGLPPSLPTTEQLTAVAAGNLAVLAVELLKQTGIPCDALRTDPELLASAAKLAGADPAIGAAAGDPCLALATYAVSQVREQVENTLEAGVAANTGLPSTMGLPGVSMKLDPRGQMTAAKLDLTMRVSQSNADATGQVCTVIATPRSRRTKDFLYPILPEKMELKEVAPFDGTGQWKGNVVFTNFNTLEGRERSFRSMEVAVKSAPGSPCKIEPFVVGSVDLAPQARGSR